MGGGASIGVKKLGSGGEEGMAVNKLCKQFRQYYNANYHLKDDEGSLWCLYSRGEDASVKEVVVPDGEDGARAIREDLVQRKLGALPAPVLFAEDSENQSTAGLVQATLAEEEHGADDGGQNKAIIIVAEGVGLTSLVPISTGIAQMVEHELRKRKVSMIFRDRGSLYIS